MKNTHGGVSLLVKLQACTKSRKASIYFNVFQYFATVFVEFSKELTLKGTLKRNAFWKRGYFNYGQCNLLLFMNYFLSSFSSHLESATCIPDNKIPPKKNNINYIVFRYPLKVDTSLLMYRQPCIGFLFLFFVFFLYFFVVLLSKFSLSP